MSHDDDLDLRRPASAPSAAPVWQVVAVVALLAAGVLLILSVGLGAALVAQLQRPRGAGGGPNAAPGFPGAVPFGGNADQEPPNPPYPLVQDMRPPGRPPVPGEEPEAEPRKTARRRFLDLGQEAWAAHQQGFPQEVSVSPDGRSVAYVDQQLLLVGPLDGEAQQVGGSGTPPGRRPGPGRSSADHSITIAGRPAWSADGQHVYFADREGRLRRYDVPSHGFDTLPFPGDSPVPLPPDGRKLVFRRSRATPRLDLPGGEPPADPRDIVLADLDTREIKVLVRDSGLLKPLAVSPDGKRLALVSGHAPSFKQPNEVRLFLLGLTDAGPSEPKSLGRPCATLTAACWTEDGKSLVYARSQQPLPPDCWEANAVGFWNGLDLFRMEADTRQETRLSRGGGYGPPSLAGGDLFFPVWENPQGKGAIPLRRVPLAAVRDFDAREPDRPARDREAWTKLMDDVLDKARVSPQAEGDVLPAEVLERLGDAFARVYREHFEAEPPASAAAWERQRRELRALTLPQPLRPRFALVLGAAQGEYLRRKHDAAWYVGAGPLVPTESPDDRTGEEDPFGIILNPFRAARADLAGMGKVQEEDDEEEPRYPTTWLEDALIRAQGRTLLLTNDPAATREALKELADPDLARSTELYENKKGAEADRLLLDLVGRKKHARNDYLVVCVGRLLYEHGRLDALRRLLEPRVDAMPRDAHRYNLLGLALLESDPSAAAQQFKNALRCDLYYGPGWLNLAQAYANAKDATAAAQCLRHYLRVLPYGPYADDARQRLAALSH
jgi:Tol biopolymer transport system component